MKAEEKTKVERSKLFERIYEIVQQIPRKVVRGDAMDAISCAVQIEKLLEQYANEVSREEAINFAHNNPYILFESIEKEDVEQAYDEWKSNQEEQQ